MANPARPGHRPIRRRAAAHMGRWIGIARVVRLLLSAAMTLVAGLTWEGIGPTFVFLAYIAVDVLIRVPLLATMSDTLGLRQPATGAAPAT